MRSTGQRIIPASVARSFIALALIVPTFALAHPKTERFAKSAFVETPEIVDCVLENGSEAQCYELTVGFLPEGLKHGPYCPETMNNAGGIWYWTGDQEGLYRIDGAFFTLLDESGYRFFNDEGMVNIVDTVATKPAFDHACINVTADEDVQMTILLPVEPVMADTPTNLETVSHVGIALDGAPIFADAPSVQDTGHLPALDNCGGHIDPGGWYHWHSTSTDVQSVLDIAKVEANCNLVQDPTAHFGYAFDGFAMYGRLDADGTIPDDLDDCGGHVGETSSSDAEIYHYHAQENFPNLPGCLVGVSAQGMFSTTASIGLGSATGQGDGPQGGTTPDLEEAAKNLGVSVESLTDAMKPAGDSRPDFSAVAAALGVSEKSLRNALPPPPNQ